VFTISVKNNGKGIPVAINDKENIYTPELIFGHMMTGSNFDDSKRRVTGGRHGYGAKLTNIFSNEFSVEIYDSSRNTLYRQEWRNNMQYVSPPTIHTPTELQQEGSYTLITFCPDLPKLYTASAESIAGTVAHNDVPLASLEDTVRLLRRRVIDVCACGLSGGKESGIAVSFNGVDIPVKSFADYIALFSSDARSNVHVANVGNRWEVGVMLSPSASFEQMSFVNSVWTARGGTHVNHVAMQCVKYIEGVLSNEDPTLSPPSATVIKNKLMIFIRCLIENPSFDSQTKDSLTTAVSRFGSQCVLPESFLKKSFDDGLLVKDLLEMMERKARKQVLTPDKGHFGKGSIIVRGLDDAHYAGDRVRAKDCTLVITEGESAKALAVAGLEAVGRDLYGVLSLKGKILNALSTRRKLYENDEVVRICQAMGLDFDSTYKESLSGLRYGRILLMTDQDTDGTHIKGLVVNFLYKYWPSLVQRQGFVQQLCTPLIKVTYTSDKRAIKKEFYSTQEYEKWRQQFEIEYGSSALDKITVKYYKGLGTSTAEDGKEYFRNLSKNVQNFVYSPETGEALKVVFCSSRISDRKKWIENRATEYSASCPTKRDITYDDFIHNDLIQYSRADIIRSLPSAIDGLKNSQRKVLYTCLHKGIRSDMKVLQLAGSVTELTSYHHGDRSLISAIIRMAQDYVGASNLPLLVPSGQFGTRHKGGKDAAQGRYIFTRLSPIARHIYHEADDPILTYAKEDGKTVEPVNYLPIIPMLLVNGSTGIGTGWSTEIPLYNPLDVVRHVEQLVRGISPSRQLHPWVRGFKGEIRRDEEIYQCNGVIKRTSGTVVEISELPVGRWTESFKENLAKLSQKSKISFTSMREMHTVDRVRFQLHAPRAVWDNLEIKPGGLMKLFSLSSTISLKNMHGFDTDMKLRKFDTAEDIVNVHYSARLDGYERRRENVLQLLRAEEMMTRNRSRFIREVISGDISLIRSGVPVSDAEIKGLLLRRGYATAQDISRLRHGDEMVEGNSSSDNFGYLLSMPMRSLTSDQADNLGSRAASAESKLSDAVKRSAHDMWLHDLGVLETELVKHDPTYDTTRSTK